jgi:hypothetical protein
VGFAKQASRYIIGESIIISFFFNAVLLAVLLFMSRDGVAQGTLSDQNPSPSFEDDPPKDGQDSPVEQDALPESQLMPPKEIPVTLKESGDKNSKEGIEDAFSKDQGDRFQSQTNKGAEFTAVK